MIGPNVEVVEGNAVGTVEGTSVGIEVGVVSTTKYITYFKVRLKVILRKY